MSWTMIAQILGAIGLIAAVAAVLVRQSTRSSAVAVAPLSDAPASYFGLAPEDAAQLEQSAQAVSRRERSRWVSDYQAESPMPGRVAGIPSGLRVRR